MKFDWILQVRPSLHRHNVRANIMRNKAPPQDNLIEGIQVINN